jgi:hypothetical protein
MLLLFSFVVSMDGNPQVRNEELALMKRYELIQEKDSSEFPLLKWRNEGITDYEVIRIQKIIKQIHVVNHATRINTFHINMHMYWDAT